MLKKAQVDHCLRLAGSDNVTNYEMRMTAEVKLYWIIHHQCCSPPVNMSETKVVLQGWQQEWAALFSKSPHVQMSSRARFCLLSCGSCSRFLSLTSMCATDQPRSQFLQMGFYFAHLLAYYQSLKSTQSTMGIPVLSEMVRLSKTIINLAIDTSDDRTRHLTDHIYHVVTFSALTIVHLLNTSESKIRTATSNDIADLDALIVKLVQWLRLIGLPCHVSHLLSDVVLAQFQKFRQASTIDTSHLNPSLTIASAQQAAAAIRQRESAAMAGPSFLAGSDGSMLQGDEPQFPFLDMISSELFGMEADVALWPQWDHLSS